MGGLKSLITGINGFVGLHLAELLASTGRDVYGMIYPHSGTKGLPDSIPLKSIIEADVAAQVAVEKAIEQVKPAEVYHLAAQSHVPTAWSDPAKTFEVNLGGTLNLLESLKMHSPDATFLMVSTGDIYSSGPNAFEDSHPVPINPYSASKLACEALAGMYVDSGPSVIIVRPFNHTGPGQAPMFALSSFAEQIALAEAGIKEKTVKVGNLDATKDYTDVRDMVKAYVIAIERCKPLEKYNICSGKTYSIAELLEMLLGLSSVEIEVKVDETKLRSATNPTISPNYVKFGELTGWKPEIPIEKTIEDLLNYWRKSIKGSMKAEGRS